MVRYPAADYSRVWVASSHGAGTIATSSRCFGPASTFERRSGRLGVAGQSDLLAALPAALESLL
jgi:hypothetical protein